MPQIHLYSCLVVGSIPDSGKKRKRNSLLRLFMIISPDVETKFKLSLHICYFVNNLKYYFKNYIVICRKRSSSSQNVIPVKLLFSKEHLQLQKCKLISEESKSLYLNPLFLFTSSQCEKYRLNNWSYDWG